jgi:8-oxo-dGTP pyrophosphatase MutT (NUDIX family)
MSSERPRKPGRREPKSRQKRSGEPIDTSGADREGGSGGGSGDGPAVDCEREVSAGGVVVHRGKVLVIVPARRAADGSLVLALPKGHPDAGETIVQAATREVREETGVTAEPVEQLGEVRYWYVRGRRRVAKSVFFFLFRYGGGDPADHDDEVLEARWMGLVEAQQALTYPGEREMVARALAICAQDR